MEDLGAEMLPEMLVIARERWAPARQPRRRRRSGMLGMAGAAVAAAT